MTYGLADGTRPRTSPRLAGRLGQVSKSRAVSLGLTVGPLVPWLYGLGAGRIWWVPPAAGVVVLWLVGRPRRPVLVPLAGGLFVGLGLMTGGALGGIAGLLGCASGLLSHSPDPRIGLTARFMLALVALGTLVMWQPYWWPTLPALIGIGALGLAEGGRPPGVRFRDWWARAVTFILGALGAAVMVFALTPRKVPGATVRILPPPPPVTFVKAPLRGAGFGRPIHSPVHLTLLGVALGLVLMGLAAWGALRMKWHWNPELSIAQGAVGTGMERLTRVPAPHEKPLEELSFTRHFIRRQIARARAGPDRSHAYETVREWAGRVFGPTISEAVAAYEDVRYGGVEDNATRASWVARRWPSRWRHER